MILPLARPEAVKFACPDDIIKTCLWDLGPIKIQDVILILLSRSIKIWSKDENNEHSNSSQEYSHYLL